MADKDNLPTSKPSSDSQQGGGGQKATNKKTNYWLFYQKEVAKSASANNIDLIDTKIPHLVKVEEEKAKAAVNNIKIIDLEMPCCVDRVSEGEFQNCTNLNSITLPNDIVYIATSTFEGCIRLTSITLPDNLAVIESRAFCNCAQLTSITLPENLLVIDDEAFAGCSNLKTINIPKSVIWIRENAFDDCPRDMKIFVQDTSELERIKTLFPDRAEYISIDPKTIEATAATIKWIRQQADTPAKVLLDILSGKIKIQDKADKEMVMREFTTTTMTEALHLAINGVTENQNEEDEEKQRLSGEPSHAQQGGGEQKATDKQSNKSLFDMETAIKIANTLIKLGARVSEKDKSGRNALHHVAIKTLSNSDREGILKIAQTLLAARDSPAAHEQDNCKYTPMDYTDTIMGKRLMIMYEQHKAGQTNITIPTDSVDRYSGTRDIDWVNLLLSYEEKFNRKQTDFNHIKKLMHLFQSKLYKCKQQFGLKDATANILCDPQIDIPTEKAVDSDGKKITRIVNDAHANDSTLTQVLIPGDVSHIGSHAFFNCPKLTNIILPKNLRFIGAGAFRNCTALESINIPEGVTGIKYRTFYNCTHLTSISIPSSITTIDASAFIKCPNNMKIYVKNKEQAKRIKKLLPDARARYVEVNSAAYPQDVTDKKPATGPDRLLLFPEHKFQHLIRLYSNVEEFSKLEVLLDCHNQVAGRFFLQALPNERHAVVISFKKYDKHKYVLSISNSGFGLRHHDTKQGLNGKHRKVKTTKSYLIDPRTLFNEVLPLLGRKPPVLALYDHMNKLTHDKEYNLDYTVEELKEDEKCFQREQKGGTCTFACYDALYKSFLSPELYRLYRLSTIQEAAQVICAEKERCRQALHEAKDINFQMHTMDEMGKQIENKLQRHINKYKQECGQHHAGEKQHSNQNDIVKHFTTQITPDTPQKPIPEDMRGGGNKKASAANVPSIFKPRDDKRNQPAGERPHGRGWKQS